MVGALTEYAASPTHDPPRVKKLRGFQPALYRLRSGDYRILFRVKTGELRVYRVIDRKDLEKVLKRLKKTSV